MAFSFVSVGLFLTQFRSKLPRNVTHVLGILQLLVAWELRALEGRTQKQDLASAACAEAPWCPKSRIIWVFKDILCFLIFFSDWDMLKCFEILWCLSSESSGVSEFAELPRPPQNIFHVGYSWTEFGMLNCLLYAGLFISNHRFSFFASVRPETKRIRSIPYVPHLVTPPLVTMR